MERQGTASETTPVETRKACRSRGQGKQGEAKNKGTQKIWEEMQKRKTVDAEKGDAKRKGRGAKKKRWRCRKKTGRGKSAKKSGCCTTSLWLVAAKRTRQRSFRYRLRLQNSSKDRISRETKKKEKKDGCQNIKGLKKEGRWQDQGDVKKSSRMPEISRDGKKKGMGKRKG